MNSNIADENSIPNDDTSQESNISSNNFSSTKKYENSKSETHQNESFPSHAQVANNPDHCLVPHNINNKQSNTQEIGASRRNQRLPSSTNHRCNLDDENSASLNPWTNIAHFHINASKFLCGGYCTLRQLNPNLGVFFVQDASSSQPLYSLLTASREQSGLYSPLTTRIQVPNDQNELSTSRKRMKYSHEERMETENSSNSRNADQSNMANGVSVQDESEIIRNILPEKRVCSKRHNPGCRKLQSSSLNSANGRDHSGERKPKCRSSSGISENSRTTQRGNENGTTDSNEDGNEGFYCKKSKRRRRAARQEFNRNESPVNVSDLNPSISYQETLKILRFMLSGRTSNNQLKAIATKQNNYLMLIEYHFFLHPYNNPEQLMSHRERSQARPRTRRPRIFNEETRAESRSNSYDGKLKIFRSQVKPLGEAPKNVEIHIRRNSIFKDSFSYISTIDEVEKLKAKLWISFEEEPGLDYGGVKREWFCLLSREIFNPDYGFFKCSSTENNYLEINPDSESFHHNHLEYFRFIGRIVGMSLYHGSLIDASFSPIFYTTLLNKKISLEDIEKVDSEYYKNLSWICENDPAELELDFTVTDRVLGKLVNIELIPNGTNVPLTNENKDFYIEHIINWKFVRRVKGQMEALHRGFYDLIPKEAIVIFTENELEKLICGTQEIDVNDWKMNTNYSEGYSSKHQTIKFFWDLVQSFNNDMRAKLLQFVTGSSKVPMNGFKNLYGSNGPLLFSIQKFGSTDSLPRSHTCFNRLDLPPYECYKQLKNKLIFAIENCAGFGGVD